MVQLLCLFQFVLTAWLKNIDKNLDSVTRAIVALWTLCPAFTQLFLDPLFNLLVLFFRLFRFYLSFQLAWQGTIKFSSYSYFFNLMVLPYLSVLFINCLKLPVPFSIVICQSILSRFLFFGNLFIFSLWKLNIEHMVYYCIIALRFKFFEDLFKFWVMILF